ncbi:MAG: folylpolyglutamate synthase/dihydrofolate synthase family protein [Thermodesulfobacteriota bacterium]
MTTASDTYNRSLERMFNLRRFGIKLGLDTIQSMLAGLHNPQDAFSSIHIAGTNGKGSIAATLAAILQAAGYTVGLYTSPHLVRFNERICINQAPISDEDVLAAYEAVDLDRHLRREPTFFEYTTAMALYEFRRKKVDWAVIETGMGGRLDATNIITPAISIISNVSLEHRQYLGNTIARIAREKGGIIKSETPLITGVRQPSAVKVLAEIAAGCSAPLYFYGKAFRTVRNRNGSFNYLGIETTWKNLKTTLAGRFQVDNAALVLAACEILNSRSLATLSLESIRTGFAQTKWPGRLEIVTTAPLVILDGAHNQAAAKNLGAYLSENLKGRRLTLVVGILEDKPYKTMLQSLLPHCNRAILTRPRIDRGLAPEKLYAVAREIVPDAVILPDVDAAVTAAIESASPQDAVCIAGSLYVVGEAKETLDRKRHLTVNKN